MTIENNRFYNLYKRTLNWALKKGILRVGDLKSQTLKFASEAGELCDAVAKDNHEDIVDAIGDVLVTLIITAELASLDPLDCLETALSVIERRSGKMVNGTFIKD